MKRGEKEFRSSNYYDLLEHQTRKLSECQIFLYIFIDNFKFILFDSYFRKLIGNNKNIAFSFN